MRLDRSQHIRVEDVIGAISIITVDIGIITRRRLIGGADDWSNRGLISLIAPRQQFFELLFRLCIVDVDVLARLQQLSVKIGDALPRAGKRLGLHRHVG